MNARMPLLIVIAMLTAGSPGAVEFSTPVLVMDADDATGIPICEEEPALSESEDADAGCDPLFEEPADEELIV